MGWIAVGEIAGWLLRRQDNSGRGGIVVETHGNCMFSRSIKGK